MGYKRDRTETLTLRLTPEEKQMLKTKAAVRNRTLTDYVLLSALEYIDTHRFYLILKKLNDIRVALEILQQKKNSTEICDALAKQQEMYTTILADIRERCSLTKAAETRRKSQGRK